MEGKTPFGAVIMGVLLLSLVLSQTQVEAKSCCKTTASRNCYNICRATGKVSQKNCAALCISCKIFEGITVCPPDYPKTSLESSAEIQVEAKPKSCCPGTLQRNCYNLCRVGGKITSETCAKTCGCKHVDGRVCPPGWQSDILSGINEYCKLGCASSVCDAISTLQISDAGEEVVNGAVEQCTEACSAFCTKGSLEIA